MSVSMGRAAFRIGEFSRLAQVSCRLLRHYDQIGLLKPAEVDPHSGYRHYRASQLATLNRILVLRDLGFSLDQVAEVMAESLSNEQLRGMLLLRRAEIERELEQHTARLRRVEQRIADLDRRDSDSPEVRFRSLPPCTIAAARIEARSFDEARAFVGTLSRELPARLAPGTLGRLLAIQHAVEYEPDALDLEIGFVLERELALGASLEVAGHSLRVRELPAVERAAVCVRVGPPDEAHRCTAIASRLEAEGLGLAGPNREVFLEPPAPDRPPVVEMQLPVAPARQRT